MILGIGSDVVDIRRVEHLLRAYGARFLNRVFTPNEQVKCSSAPEDMRPSQYAKRFAAKEAISKALGTGIAQGVRFLDIEVSNLFNGKPVVTLTHQAHAILSAQLGPQERAQIEISMSDEYPIAQAFAVISKTDKPQEKK